VGSITELLEGLDASAPPAAERQALLERADTPTLEETPTVFLEQGAQGGPVVRLQVSVGPSQGSIFEVGTAGGTVGRLPANLIHLADGRLSREHARIEFRGGSFWITDLASQNGTIVNGRLLSEAHQLREGDTIDIGTSRLMVVSESEVGE
jgi:pSer/pThr/pTyr-binding forkhead associated (FHA) protein